MFRRKKTDDDGISAMGDEEIEASGSDLPPLKPFMRAGEDKALAPVRQGPRVELTRRLADMPSAAARNPAPAIPTYAPQPAHAAPASPALAAPESEGKKLIVGRDIRLNGEIVSCEHLVVEGSVEATLTDGKLIDIAETGNFRGNAECETAVIRGRFDGELTCRDRLVIRGTGKVLGKIRYRQLEVERGGEVSGDVQMIQSQGGSVTSIFGADGDGKPAAAASSD